MASEAIPALQRRLIQRLEEVEALMVELAAEKSALERLLLRERAADVSNVDPLRRNSIARIIVEERVVELLQGRQTPVHGGYLLAQIKRLLPDMKTATFRSHLHRMRGKGLIRSTVRPGFWLSAADPEAAT